MAKKNRIEEQAVDCIRANKSLGSIGDIGRVNDRLDLRDISFPKPFAVKGYRFENIDFSSADLSSIVFEKCGFTNCLFENTDMRSVSLEAMIISDCHFNGANLRDSYIGTNIGKDSGEIQRTVFRKTDLTEAHFTFPVINETVFDECTIKGVSFDGSRFSNCTFKGKVSSSFFRGYSHLGDSTGFKLFNRVNYKEFPNKMLNVDFTQCELYDVSFSHGIDLSSCRFPVKENYVLVKDLKKVYGKAKEIISQTWPADERNLYLQLIDQVHYDKTRQGQAMDLIDYWPSDDSTDKRLFDLIKQINDSV